MMIFKLIACIILAWIASISAAMPTGDTVTNSIGMKFKRIPAGNFEIGFEGDSLKTTIAWAGRVTLGIYNEHPRHSVTISRAFYMGLYEVTNIQFKRYLSTYGSNIAWYDNRDSLPAYRITWPMAAAFCEWLTANDPDHFTYRLPTEAEWEYCCRAGTTTPYYTGDSITESDAHYGEGYGWRYDTVGRYHPNPWGLYDMCGNAPEWCLDWYGLYESQPKTDPAGYESGELRVQRGVGTDVLFWMRSSTRFALPGDSSLTLSSGFRVVIGETSQLTFLAVPDTLFPYQRNVAAGLPVPSTLISGESYTDGEGISFSRVRMSRRGYTQQRDSVVYVSDSPVTGDSSLSRTLAGLYAKRLSQTYGIQYHLSNKYELESAGKGMSSSFYLTILPDVPYSSGRPHPDESYYVWRQTAVNPRDNAIGGPLYYSVNHVAHLGEAPNGDLIATWYSGYSEDQRDDNIVGSRLRFGTDSWDSQNSCIMDVPGYCDVASDFWYNSAGVLFNFHSINLNGGVWVRTSPDNGVTWSASRQWASGVEPGKGHYELGKDTVCVTTDMYYGNKKTLLLSFDNGDNWIQSPGTTPGCHPTTMPLDDGRIMVFARNATVKNSDSVETMYGAVTSDLGNTWQSQASPFYPQQIGQYDVLLKLFSGRLLMATRCGAVDKGGINLVESIDSGKSWFCRRKFTAPRGQPNSMQGYKDMVQGRDGIIHLVGTHGSGTGNGNNPQVSFSEEWLRQGSCLDVADWGINTAGMIADCPDESGTTVVKQEVAPVKTLLLANSPNPFNPSTTIRYELPGGVQAGFTIFGINGRAIRSFDLGKVSGKGAIEWDGRDGCGKAVPSGLYLGRLSLGSGQERNIRMLMVK